MPVLGHGGPRILLVTTPQSYRTYAYLEAAERLGMPVTVASDAQYALTPRAYQALQIQANDPTGAVTAILHAHRDTPFAAMVGCDDASVELASRAAASAGLAHNPPAATRAARRKDHARRTLAETGVTIPEFRILDLTAPCRPQTRGFPFPAVLKPLAMSASRGVMRVDSPAALTDAAERLRGILRDELDEEERTGALLERFVPGREVAVEGILRAGTLEVLTIFDKPDALDGPFFEETYYVTPSRLPERVLGRARATVAAACRAYGLLEGPVHAELRIDGDGRPCVMEVAARTIGGQCARLLEFGSGHRLEDVVLARAAGWELTPASPETASGVLMIPTPEPGILRRVEGVSAARRVPGIDEVIISIREGYELVPLPEGASYLGFIFARGPSAEAVEAALREAHACLRIIVTPLMPVVIGAGMPNQGKRG